MKNATRSNFIGNATFEALEDRRLMSKVALVDGMLILQGNAQGHNRLTVSPDANGQTLFARANNVKKHYLATDVKSIRMVGGEKSDKITIDGTLKQNAFIRAGAGADSVVGGAGSDSVFGGAGGDTLRGGQGDDLLVGGAGPDKIDAGNTDNPDSITPHQNSQNKAAVTSLKLIDATTNKVILTLENGARLNLASLPKRLNVAANLSSQGLKGSVRFSYDGQDLTTAENLAPYALAGDHDGDYSGWQPRIGPHTLKATPYAGKNATGAAGTEMLVMFTVVDDPTDVGNISDATSDEGGSTDDNSNQADAPTANIAVLDSTVPEDTAVHVNALKSTLKSGDWLGATFEWNFGDAGSKYNTLVGFNAAHVYVNPGEYTVTLKVTNSAGASDTVTSKVTVTAGNRRKVYVSTDGNDANNGSSQGNAVKTFKRAAQLVDDNTEVLFERGGTYSTGTATMDLGHSNVVVGAFGTGAKPVIKYTGGQDYDTIFTTLNGKDVTVRDVTFDSSNTSTSDTGYNDGVRLGGQNITVRDCTFKNVGYALNSNGHPDGVLAQDNDTTGTGSIRAYFAWVQGSDHVYLGNKVKDSIRQHVLRQGGADRVLIAYNDFANALNMGTVMKGTLTLHKGSFVYVTHNKLTDGNLAIGPLDSGAGLDDKGARLKWTVVEDNTIDSVINVLTGTEHTAIRNNVVLRDDGAAFDVKGYSDQYDRGVVDAYFVHNTVLNNGTTGKFMKVSGQVSNVTVANNLYVAPHLETGSYDTAPMQVLTGDLSGFKVISDNVWPSPTILSFADGGINFVGQAGQSGSYKTPAEWEAYSQVKHDQYKDVTLGQTFMVSLGGITAGADTAK